MQAYAMALSLRHQLERCRVDAITQPRRRRPIRKHMPQVSIALGAFDFDAVHAVIEVIQADYGLAADRLKITRPAATGVVLGIRVEQFGLTAGAMVNARDRKSTRLNSSHSQISYALLFF